MGFKGKHELTGRLGRSRLLNTMVSDHSSEDPVVEPDRLQRDYRSCVVRIWGYEERLGIV